MRCRDPMIPQVCQLTRAAASSITSKPSASRGRRREHQRTGSRAWWRAGRWCGLRACRNQRSCVAPHGRLVLAANRPACNDAVDKLVIIGAAAMALSFASVWSVLIVDLGIIAISVGCTDTSAKLRFVPKSGAALADRFHQVPLIAS